MFDDGDDTRRKESSGTHRVAGARDFNDLDRGSSDVHFDAAASFRRNDVEVAHPVADVHHDLDAITAHGDMLGRIEFIAPRVSDPRLHVAAVIVTVQVFGQTSFHFEVSIAQILVAVVTCAVLDIVIVARREHVLAWPASALLTGNGTALLLRVNGTQHGDWWSMRGWWIFAGTGALGIASKHLLRRGDAPVFNPSNLGLVVCFVVLGTNRVNPQDLWWGPLSPALVFVIVFVIVGGLLLAQRLHLAGVSAAFWLAFAGAVGVVALAGHAMTARWHVGTVNGTTYWWILVTSPEVLIFLFFMITDPQTMPRSPRARVLFGGAIGLMSALFASAAGTEFATKLALLVALAVACAARPLFERESVLRLRPIALGGIAFVVVLAVVANSTAAHPPHLAAAFEGEIFVPSDLPPVAVDPAVTRAGAHVDVVDAQRLAAQAFAVLTAETSGTYTLTTAAVVLVHDGAQPQAPPKLGVRLTGNRHDTASDAPFDRTIAVNA